MDRNASSQSQGKYLAQGHKHIVGLELTTLMVCGHESCSPCVLSQSNVKVYPGGVKGNKFRIEICKQ